MYHIQTKWLYLWEKRIRIYIYIFFKITITRIPLHFPFSIVSNDSILKSSPSWSALLHPSSLFEFLHVTVLAFFLRREPFVRDTHRTFGEIERNEGIPFAVKKLHSSSSGGEEGHFFLERSWMLLSLLPSSACGFVNCFHDNSPFRVSPLPVRIATGKLLVASRPIVIYAPPLPSWSVRYFNHPITNPISPRPPSSLVFYRFSISFENVSKMYSVHIWRKGHLPLFRLSEIEGGERNYDVIEILLIKKSLVSRFNRFNRICI